MKCKQPFNGKECGGTMRPGTALTNQDTYGSPDFPGDTGMERGCTMNIDTTRATMVSVMKCEKCGHSFQPTPTKDGEGL